ncbi:hypothetical protein J1N35_001683 [Gossypium stocksii]|uniref:Uncharacterized protein n=1 Tax=Gossypium stocksii TaxID=47602 RepID=A0A9D4AJV0_9ROSI|nr:hypothetical protein J1N35_001683 [Gossypium stocksii]
MRIIYCLIPHLSLKFFSQNYNLVRSNEAYGKPIPKLKFSYKWLEGKQVVNEPEEIHHSNSSIPEVETTRQEVATPIDSNPISKDMRTKANVDFQTSIDFYQKNCNMQRAEAKALKR